MRQKITVFAEMRGSGYAEMRLPGRQGKWKNVDKETWKSGENLESGVPGPCFKRPVSVSGTNLEETSG